MMMMELMLSAMRIEDVWQRNANDNRIFLLVYNDSAEPPTPPPQNTHTQKENAINHVQ